MTRPEHREVKLCSFTGCREVVGPMFVCRAHFRDLPLMLQRALTGSRGPERHAAEQVVRKWIQDRTLPAG